AHALGSNCRPRRWKLDRSQRSLDARLGSSNTLGTLFATAIGEPLRSRRRTTRRACLDDKLLAALLIASCPRFGEFVPGLPANQRWLVGREPSQRDTEARRHRVAAKIHLRIIFVARLVVALRDEFLGLVQTPLGSVALVLDALVDGERRHSGAREAEVVGAVIMSRAGLRIGHDLEAEVLRGAFDCGIKRGALSACDVDFFRHAERRNVVVVQIERDALRRNWRMLAEKLGAAQTLLFRRDCGEIDRALGLLRRQRERARDLQQNAASSSVILRAV